MISFLLVIRAGIKDRLKELRRLERLIPGYIRKNNFNKRRNSFIPIFI
jgi:hypothetical protein